MEGQVMVRTGIATLMVCVIGATSVSADDAATQNSGTLIEWLTSGNDSQRRSLSIEQAVVSDASRQAPRIRQTSDTPVAPPYPGALPLVPLPIQSAPQYQAPQPVYRNSPGMYSTISQGVAQGPVAQAQGTSASGAPLHPGTALYPSPIPGIPQQMGGTTISNQFLNPHEMLYAHQYRAMYPPYSYKVNGKWMVTPFGVWSHEDWHLQGTMVDVKYKSSISPFALFTPPVRH
jgi:hypothetical protein